MRLHCALSSQVSLPFSCTALRPVSMPTAKHPAPAIPASTPILTLGNYCIHFFGKMILQSETGKKKCQAQRGYSTCCVDCSCFSFVTWHISLPALPCYTTSIPVASLECDLASLVCSASSQSVPEPHSFGDCIRQRGVGIQIQQVHSE